MFENIIDDQWFSTHTWAADFYWRELQRHRQRRLWQRLFIAEYLYCESFLKLFTEVVLQKVVDEVQTVWLQCLHVAIEHGDKRLKPVVQLLHLVRQGGSQVFSGILEAVLDVLSSVLYPVLHVLQLRLQQIIQGGDLCLGVVTHLRKIRLETRLHLPHVVWGAGLKLLNVFRNMSERRMKHLIYHIASAFSLL